MEIKKVYVVIESDRDGVFNVKVFSSEDKAEKYSEKINKIRDKWDHYYTEIDICEVK